MNETSLSFGNINLFWYNIQYARMRRWWLDKSSERKMKILDFLYYRLYKLLLKTTVAYIAEHFAYMSLSLLLSTNLVVIVKNLGINLLEIASARFWGTSVSFGMMIFFYFLFVRSKRYLKLAERYANETKSQRISGNLILLGYVIITFTALFLF